MDLFFRRYLEKKDQYRFWLAIVFISILLLLVIWIGYSIIKGIELNNSWKDIILVILGALLGNIGKIFDFFFNSLDTDNKLIDKVDEEDDVLEEVERSKIQK